MSAPANYATGIDLSKWNTSYDPYKKPVDFTIHKATEGWAKDPKFDSLVKDASPVRIKGAYHYYRSGVSWKVQADNFLATVRPYIVSGIIQFLAVDYEKINNALSKQTDDELYKMMDYLAMNSGVPVLLYTQFDMVAKEMPARGSTWMKKFHLWVARWYEKNYYEKYATGPGIEYTLWQFGGDFRHPSGWVVPGYKQGAEYGVENDNIDLNVFNGTVEQMRAWLGIEPEPLEGEASTKPARRRFLQPMPR